MASYVPAAAPHACDYAIHVRHRWMDACLDCVPVLVTRIALLHMHVIMLSVPGTMDGCVSLLRMHVIMLSVWPLVK